MFRWFLFFLFFSVIFSFIDSDYSKSFFLKENYKYFFKKPINYQYFSNNIELNSNLFPSIKGKEQYQFFFNSLQFFSKKIFSNYQIDILSTKETIDTVELLWKLKGRIKTFYPISIEGFSSYEKNSNGYLTSHNITLFIKPNPIFQYYNNSIPEIFQSYCLLHKECLYKDECFFRRLLQEECCKNNHYPHPWLKKPIKVFKE